ncbi:latent-transforming growth factor beta-binding protein 4 isoform X4 [Erythrolamprus reginae]|uniref:latent-transforming growth factor beta-binding protein 4 isoform X4 n=1 Tax=Erythrolamprus reginae TaxID=121349 RepID=UPI00396CDC68
MVGAEPSLPAACLELRLPAPLGAMGFVRRPPHCPLPLLLLLLLLGAHPSPGQGQQVKVLFTPTICHTHCSNGRCVNRCELGNATTLYSGGAARAVEGAAGFRVFLCPLICQNGGVCLKKDKCLCPHNWTGKFCHIPAFPSLSQGHGPARPGTEGDQAENRRQQSVHTLPIANHRYERDGMASLVNVHVEHPPEASVTIHQVERVSEELLPSGPNAASASRAAPSGVLAQSSRRDPAGGYEESSGFGYCFQQLRGQECRAPLPGLRTQEVCCRGAGVAWGVHGCLPCADGDLGASGPGGRSAEVCPRGFLRTNGSCVDVDECQEGNFCHNGQCTNTRGSFACLCHEGYILDSSRSSCISHHVISEVRAPCFRVLRDGRCSLPTLRNITQQICCCSRVGKAWGWGCQHCPPFGSEGFKDICPAGPGYHYSASDLRFDARFLGQEPPRVPVTSQQGRQGPRTTADPALVALWSTPPPTTGLERFPWPPPTRPPASGPAAPSTEEEARPGTCERQPQVCGPGRCIPRGGSYTCVCNRGYWLSPQGTHCVDVDECRSSPRPCANGHCQNSLGSFSCRCHTGFQADPSGVECQDVDECAHVPHPCGGGHCLNTLGSFRCSCPSGYQPDPSGTDCQDVDECQKHPSLCQPGRCENVPGGYRCSCPIGYQPNPLGTLCADVDECLQSPPPCGSGRCENVPGGYRCLCPAGFRASLTENECLDMDECAAAAGLPCGPGGRCLNTEGSFRCQCARGYRPEGAGGTSCVDIDECLGAAVCAGGHCANTEGSFDCYCPPGSRSTPSKASCEDIDECQEYGAALCGTQRCENSAGSYRCVVACQAGYLTSATGDCVDVDECQAPGACGEKRCENTLGSYRCVAPCQMGYQATASGDCTDVDECQNSSTCGVHAVCHNLLGSFQCICDQGYESARDGRHCLDVNECETLPGVCGTTPCENVEGSFLCLCPQAGEEFDPMTGHCLALPSAGRPPVLPRHPDAGQLESVDGLLRRECYYDLNAAQVCENVLARNATRQECCCSLGHGWGLDCHIQACPSIGTAEFQALCPHGSGYVALLVRNAPAVADVDECALFGAQVCKGGVCVNKVPSYSCYCPNGYYYEVQHLECIDNDECLDEEAEPCVGGHCINTIGSYYCSCAAPLVLDPSQRRCVTNESHGLGEDLAICWQEVGPDLVCRRPRLDRQVSYTECCCLYGEAWSINCALCPARDSGGWPPLCRCGHRERERSTRPWEGKTAAAFPFPPGVNAPSHPKASARDAALPARVCVCVCVCGPPPLPDHWWSPALFPALSLLAERRDWWGAPLLNRLPGPSWGASGDTLGLTPTLCFPQMTLRPCATSSRAPVTGWGSRAASGPPLNMAGGSSCLSALMSTAPWPGRAPCSLPSMRLCPTSRSTAPPPMGKLAWTRHPMVMHSWRPQPRTPGRHTGPAAHRIPTGPTHPVGSPTPNGPVGLAKTTMLTNAGRWRGCVPGANASTWRAPTTACAPLAPRPPGGPSAAFPSPAAEPELGRLGNIYYLSRGERRKGVKVKGPFAHRPWPAASGGAGRGLGLRGGGPLLLFWAMG